MNLPLGDEIAYAASQLEQRLMTAIRDDDYPVENLPILEAAALEVAELEYSLAVGGAVLLWTGPR